MESYLLVFKSLWIMGLLLASLSDIRTRKIPNYINFSYLACGILYQVSISSSLMSGLWLSLQGILCTLLILIIPFALYIYRGGDVKLCMAAGAWLGPETIIYAVAYAIILGGIWGIIQIALMPKKNRSSRVQNLKSVLYTKQMPALEPDTHSQQYIPMALLFSLSIFYCGYSYVF